MSGTATHGRCGRRVIALAAAVFTLVALAALLAGLWFAAFQEYRVGGSMVRDRRAFDAAEAGLDGAVAGWDPRALNRLGAGDSVPFTGSLSDVGASYSGSVRPLGPQLFLIRSTGVAGSSRRTLGVVARLAPLGLARMAALVASRQVRIGAGALVDGLAGDSSPSCAGPPWPAVGVILGSAADLAVSCPGGGCLGGDPASSVDSAVRNQSVPLLGETGWESLIAAADTIIPGGSPSSSSLIGFAPGDLSLPAGPGSAPGVLLVQGDLLIETGARLTGLVVVRGRLIMRGAGGRIAGSAIAGGADLSAFPGAQSALVYSQCAVDRALAAAAPARPLRERSWTAIY